MNPRLDPECPDCPGEFVYREQGKDGRGQSVSVYECQNCGRSERVR